MAGLLVSPVAPPEIPQLHAISLNFRTCKTTVTVTQHMQLFEYTFGTLLVYTIRKEQWHL